MADKEVQIKLTAIDQASSTLSKVSGGFKELTGISLPTAISVAAVAEGFRELVSAGMEQQVAMAKFNTIMNNSKGVTDQVKEALLQASESAIKFGFEGDDAALAMAKFYQRTNDVTSSVALAGIAMDLSRDKHMQLSEAANVVGMVMSGNGRILKQYGIDVKETSGPLEQLQELQEKLKGSAEAYSHTVEGQIEVMKTKWKELKETIGSQILPIMEKVLDAINRVADYITEGFSNAIRFARAVWDSNFMGIRETVTEFYNKVSSVLEELYNDFNSYFGEYAKIIIDHWKEIVTVVLGYIEIMVTYFSTGFDMIWTTVSSVLTVIGALFQAWGATITGIVAMAMNMINGDWNAAWQAMADTFGNVWNAIYGALVGVFNKIMSLIHDISANVSGLPGMGGVPIIPLIQVNPMKTALNVVVSTAKQTKGSFDDLMAAFDKTGISAKSAAGGVGKLGDALNNIGGGGGGKGGKGGGAKAAAADIKALTAAFKSADESISKDIENTRKKAETEWNALEKSIEGVQDNIKKATDDYNKNAGDRKNTLAEAIVANDQAIADSQKAIAQKRQELMKEDQDNGRSDQYWQLQNELTDLQSTLQKEQNAKAKTANYENALITQIQDAKDRAQMTDLERAAADYEAQTAQAQQEYQLQVDKYHNELVAYQKQQQDIQTQANETISKLQEMQQRLRDDYAAKMADQKSLTKNFTDAAISNYKDLEGQAKAATDAIIALMQVGGAPNQLRVSSPFSAASSAGVTSATDANGAEHVSWVNAKRATGGPTESGKRYLVGEEGPEILTMGDSNGFITPNPNTGKGGVTIVANFNGPVSSKDVAMQYVEMFFNKFKNSAQAF